MPRIRTIKPEFPQSESMGRVSRDARLCFIMLWTQADDEGRLRGSSRMLASILYPYDDDASLHIGDWFAELEREKCIVRYEVDGKHYIQILNWAEHQKIDHPTKSRFPSLREIAETLREEIANPREPIENPRSGSKEGTKDQGEDQEPREQARDQPTKAAEVLDEQSVRRARPRTRITADWKPDEQDIGFGFERGWSLERCFAEGERCRDHHLAKGTLTADIHATWRTWVQNGVRFDAEKRPGRNPQGDHGFAAAVRDALSGPEPPVPIRRVGI